MKKIGIVTFHNAHNYGAMLQVYALQKILSEKYDVEIINYINPIIKKNYKSIRISNDSVISFIKSLGSSIIYLPETLKRQRNFNEFLRKYLKVGEKYDTEETLKNNPPKKDIYITGSDQVWNYTLTNGLSDIYTLNFGDKKTKRISYAASIGVGEIPDNQKDIYNKKISIIDSISVRELQAQKILSELIKKDIYEVLDPTLLLSREEWEKLIKNKINHNEKYILVYGIGNQNKLSDIANYLSKETNNNIIHFNKTNSKFKNILKRAYTYSPTDFLYLVKNAEYTIVRSFHGMVFSILFHKKFFVIPDESSGSRVYDLLRKLGLSDRIVNGIDDLGDFTREIDYSLVDKILKKEREKSMNFLETAIEKTDVKR